ncbi:MAG TPA: hypothetical protein VF316_23580 [Polyangiaceae bacterium]
MRKLWLVVPVVLVLACSSTETPTGPDAQADAPVDAPKDGAVSDAPSTDAAGDVASFDAGQCGPDWKPTQCADCTGGGTSTTCTQGCDPTSCGDNHYYFAKCDLAAGTCQCFIDQVQACSCKITKPDAGAICEPEQLGGVNCCWNVG